MSRPLIQEVTDLVNELGEASCAALMGHLPGYSHRQVIKALQNARSLKRIRLVRRGKALGRGKGNGSEPGVYGPMQEQDEPAPAVSEPARSPVASVWELGTRA